MVTEEYVVTEEGIMAFARLTGDDNPMHTDPDYAKTHMFGQQVAHGLLVLSVASGLAWRLGFMQGTVLAFRDLEWKFSRPVFIGDRIRVRAEVHQRKTMSRLGGGAVVESQAVSLAEETSALPGELQDEAEQDLAVQGVVLGAGQDPGRAEIGS